MIDSFESRNKNTEDASYRFRESSRINILYYVHLYYEILALASALDLHLLKGSG